MYAAKMSDPKWLKQAFSELELKVSEKPGRKINHPRILDYWAAIGHKEIKDDETAWCAAFVGFCLENVKVKSTCSAAAISYRRWGKSVRNNVTRGAVGIFKRAASESWQAHVGFIIDITPTHYIVLGGNQRNSVSIQRYDKKSLIDARWPLTAGNSGTIKAVVAGAAIEATPRIMETFTDVQSIAGEMAQYWDYAQYVFSACSIACLGLAIWLRYKTIKDNGK